MVKLNIKDSEKMKKIIIADGNEACSQVAYMFSEVSGIYPITPSSPMAEHVDEWSNNGKLNIFNDTVKVVEMQSEAGAAGMVHGSLQAGLLTTTFTASQGLLLMIPNMYKIAGEMLPTVFHVAARSLSTHALSIFGDHQDIYATRMTGFAMLASSSVQDSSYLAGISHLSAIEASMPFLHFFDGFRTSHEINKIEVLEQSDYESMLNKEKVKEFRNRALNPNAPKTKGTAQNDDIYFQAMEAKNIFYDKLPDIVNKYMEKINELANTNYKPFNYYGSSTASKVIVAMGSVNETIKETIDALGGDIGLLEVHLYRPFSSKYFLNVLPSTVKSIAVLDRTKEHGSVGEPLYLDVISILKDKNINIVGGRYGLSSKNTTPAQIKSIYDMLDSPKNNFTIGIEDDVTNLSLDFDCDFKTKSEDEILIYGYGSDGMISASKSLISLVGNNTSNFVQGYFEYDSKKSGGVTISHLRFGKEKIRKPYYVENPSIIVISKESYLKEFDILDKLEKNGICLINTTNEQDLLENMNKVNYQVLQEKNIKLYIINAYELARKVGLQNKISMIMEMAILKISKIVDINLATNELKKYISKKFIKAGDKIIESNFQALEEVDNYLKEITNIVPNENEVENMNNTIFDILSKRKGYSIKTSEFVKNNDGSFDGGTSSLEKRGISDFVPKWISSNCIRCNQCSLVCPHGVIRPYLLSEEEYNLAPDYVQKKCVKGKGKELEDFYYIIGISIEDCTGCGVCIKICPGLSNNKALIFEKLFLEKNSKEQEIFNYLDQNIKDKKIINNNTVIGSQFSEPKFTFSGACAGCGETAYIKLLTQLFGEQLIIANATGCSSIYGASCPSMPYTIPWASSLFEDNAEFGYGILVGNNVIKTRIYNIMKNNQNENNKEIFNKWLENNNNYEITKEVYDNLEKYEIPEELSKLKEFIKKRSIWTIGGDGWAYDIGFGGIDHVLASNDNVNILVLDSQVYSNTGGQSSKSSPTGAVLSFASTGKNTTKKDLSKMALAYPNVYVAQVSIGANMLQVIKAFKEAEQHNGPSIIIAYTPCISHGIEGGLKNSVECEKQATACGYFLTFRYNPETKKFILDSKNVDFNQYNDFLNTQSRFKMLDIVNKENKENLLYQNKLSAIERYNYYKMLSEKE
ncbi:MAG: pyruvate:ferredoxin (flavodoxin) oxidoreductase [Bacilli bacterium]